MADATSLPLAYPLGLAALLFALGLVTVLVRRNLLFMLLGVEIMLNACGLAFVAAAAAHRQTDGRVMFLLILVMAAAEVSVGLALLLRLQGKLGDIDADAADELRG